MRTGGGAKQFNHHKQLCATELSLKYGLLRWPRQFHGWCKVTKCTSEPTQSDEWECDVAKISSHGLIPSRLIFPFPQPWLLHHTSLVGWRDGGDGGGDHVQVDHAEQQGAHQGGHLQVRLGLINPKLPDFWERLTGIFAARWWSTGWRETLMTSHYLNFSRIKVWQLSYMH